MAIGTGCCKGKIISVALFTCRELMLRIKLIGGAASGRVFVSNALPDSGDALNTKGVSTFWYHPQAHGLAVFLHNYLVENFPRPSYGIFWNNLALTRPHTALSLLLELGFMINPEEFAWIINPTEQRKLAVAIADGITLWLQDQDFED